jgi:hypothetical protein
MPQILTANRLTKGEVVYWNSLHGWVLTLGGADLFDGPAGEDALKRAAESVRKREVVNPYLFEVRLEGGAAHPVKMRELIRAAGPTVRRDLGKQAGKTA